MVEAEFANIWTQVEEELKREGKTAADEGKSEDELKAEYRKIAERRVRLGLVLGKLGEQNGITIAGTKCSAPLLARARQFPGQEQQVFQFYANNPQAQAEIRAPLFEDKVVDFIAELARSMTARWTGKPCSPIRKTSGQGGNPGAPSARECRARVSAAERYINVAGRFSGYCLLTNHRGAAMTDPDPRILQQHARADGGRTDRPRRARLRHLFAPAEGTADLRHRSDRGLRRQPDHRPASVSRGRKSQEGNRICTSTRRAGW